MGIPRRIMVLLSTAPDLKRTETVSPTPAPALLDTLITKEDVPSEQWWQCSVLEEHPGKVSSVRIETRAFPCSAIDVTMPRACFMVFPSYGINISLLFRILKPELSPQPRRNGATDKI